jgi:hypothetical protein
MTAKVTEWYITGANHLSTGTNNKQHYWHVQHKLHVGSGIRRGQGCKSLQPYTDKTFDATGA